MSNEWFVLIIGITLLTWGLVDFIKKRLEEPSDLTTLLPDELPMKGFSWENDNFDRVNLWFHEELVGYVDTRGVAWIGRQVKWGITFTQEFKTKEAAMAYVEKSALANMPKGT